MLKSGSGMSGRSELKRRGPEAGDDGRSLKPVGNCLDPRPVRIELDQANGGSARRWWETVVSMKSTKGSQAADD